MQNWWNWNFFYPWMNQLKIYFIPLALTSCSCATNNYWWILKCHKPTLSLIQWMWSLCSRGPMQEAGGNSELKSTKYCLLIKATGMAATTYKRATQKSLVGKTTRLGKTAQWTGGGIGTEHEKWGPDWKHLGWTHEDQVSRGGAWKGHRGWQTKTKH